MCRGNMKATRCIVDGSRNEDVEVNGEHASAELVECDIRNNGNGGLFVTHGKALLQGDMIWNNGHAGNYNGYGLSVNYDGKATLQGVTKIGWTAWPQRHAAKLRCCWPRKGHRTPPKIIGGTIGAQSALNRRRMASSARSSAPRCRSSRRSMSRTTSRIDRWLYLSESLTARPRRSHRRPPARRLPRAARPWPTAPPRRRRT